MRRLLAPVAITALFALTGCGGNATNTADDGAAAEQSPAAGDTTSASGTVTIETNHGPMEVPVNPQRVVALDNTSFETLQAFGITPVAAPKPLLPSEMTEWEQNEEILDVGSHREPQLEVVAQAEPDLIIGGKRFESVTADLQSIAPVIDIAPDTEADGYMEALKTQTTALGSIFDKEAEANELNANLDAAIERAAGLTDGQTAFLAVHNGGKIDNGAGRMSPVLQPLNMTDVFATEANSESVHQDSGLAPETVAQANPDVMIVMDRDAAVSSSGESAGPASQTIAAQSAWANTTFMQNDAIAYLADNFYVTEGIQAYTDAYEQIADALEGTSAGQ